LLEERRTASGVDADGFRSALRRHASGVVVVTSSSADGRVAGLTVTSLTSLSLHPPLVSFNIAHAASAYEVIANSSRFVVNFLAHDQTELAVRFASRGVDRFAPPTSWDRLPDGEPVLLDAPAWMECEVVDRISVGDHLLVIGRAGQASVVRGHAPLIYHEGRYSSLRTDAQRRWWGRWRRREVRHEAEKPGSGG